MNKFVWNPDANTVTGKDQSYTEKRVYFVHHNPPRTGFGLNPALRGDWAGDYGLSRR
jgi:hypothetical protein